MAHPAATRRAGAVTEARAGAVTEARTDALHADFHRILTAAVIAAIEHGETTNAMPWADGGPLPLQLGSGTPWRGVNALHLRAVARVRGYRSATWGGFPARRARGGHVRRGERGTLVVSAHLTGLAGAPDAPTDGPGTRRVVRSSTVFNRDQVDGLPDEPAPRTPAATPYGEDDRALVARIDAFADGLGVRVRRSGPRAFYHRRTDSVTVPPLERFTGIQIGTPGIGYASTLAHELVHWSGSGTRAARPIEPGRVGYAREVLVAELGAARLAEELGFAYGAAAEHASYLGDWLELLRGDDRALVRALRDASAAAAWLLDHGRGARAVREPDPRALADA